MRCHASFSRFLTLAVLIAAMIGITSCGNDAKVNSVEDIEDQIERQVRQTDGLERRPDEVHILHFRPSNTGLVIQIEVQWDRRTTSNTEVQFASVSDRFALGTLVMPELGKPVNLMLRFPD